jgi:probable HAF family extracellular repeat protein
MGTSHLFHRACRVISLLLVSWLCLQLAGQAAPRPHFDILDLGTLPGGDAVFPFALNNHGHVVGWAFDSNGVSRAFLFREGSMTELPLLVHAGYAFSDINDAGHIVAVGFVNNCCYRTYFITPDGITDLHAQTGLDVTPVGINNSSVIALNSWRADFTTDAITWSNGVVRYLNPNHRTGARDINNRGEVVGMFYLETPPGPSIFTAIMRDDTVSVLGPFAGDTINDHGHVAGHSFVGGRRAALYRDGALLDLGTLRGDYFSWAWRINNADQIIGVSEDGDDHTRPFFYTDGNMYPLNDLIHSNSGWTIHYVTDINDRGQIVGAGIHLGQYRAFLLTPTKKLR